jgi:hypothetical protein
MVRYISGPRPMWHPEEEEENRKRRVLTLGSVTGGVVVRVTKEGIEINGYYAGLQEGKKYANLRDFLLISWDDFDRLRSDVFRNKKPEKKFVEREPDRTESAPSKEYLDGLLQVTLNGKQYYVDVDRKERRPVDNPENVFNFEKLASRSPS